MDQQQGIVMLGLMSALRTGHMIFDTAVALLLPNIFTILWQHLQRVFSKGTESVKARTNRSYIRTIEHTRSTRPWAATAAAHKNKILIKAIRAYIGRKVQPTYPSGAVKLQSVQSSSSNESLNKVEQLEKRFHIVTVPPRGERVEVTPGLFFTDSEVLTRDENEEGKKKASTVSTTTVLCFTTDVAGGEERVNSFIKTAYDWYVNEVETSEDHSYFMYQPLVQKYSSADDAPKGTKFKRYRLSGEKTFKSIFFPEKEKVLRILKHFADKTGKYSIKGFPHKLGLLLHGPPGTGKTSLVKAIATHMKRHIISVPLSRIRTNQELMDVMFDQVFKYDEPRKSAEGESTETKNKHLISEVVFLLEDVDAASKVVHARETVATGAGANTPTAGMAREKSMVAKKEVDNDNESTLMRQLSTALTRQATSNREVAAEAAAPAGNAESTGESPSPLEKQATTVPGEGGDKEGEKKDETADPQATKKSMWDEADKLDLAGLLNVLDGVVDAPGRVLIMTTNHPEKLDPALLRPGRVNLQIYMGFISCEDAVHMTSHYYPSASPEQLESVRQAWETKHRKCVNGLKLSPAEYEQICAESDTIPQLLSAMDKLVPKR